MNDELAKLKAENEQMKASLAECYRLSGADPDGNEDWRLAPYAVEEVRRMRAENDEYVERIVAMETAQKVPPPPEGYTAWNGGECPVADDTEVFVVLRNRRSIPMSSKPRRAHWMRWTHGDTQNEGDDIVAYRVAPPNIHGFCSNVAALSAFTRENWAALKEMAPEDFSHLRAMVDEASL